MNIVERFLIDHNFKAQFFIGGPIAPGDPYGQECAAKMAYLKQKYPWNFWADPFLFFRDGEMMTLGCDFGMMPSAFEPGGIVQHEFFVANTPVVAYKTGGLKDTVFNYSKTTKKGNGFVFDVYNEDALYGSFASAYKLFQDKKHYAIARVNAYDGAIDITDQATSWNKEFYRLFNRIFVNPALVLPLKKEIKLEDEEQKITRKMSVESPDIFDVIPYKFYNLLKMNLKSVLMRRRTKFKIRIDILPAPKSVYIAGSWDNWETKHEMLFNSLSQTWDCYIQIMPGTYYYKFNDETTWFVNKQAAVEVDEDANENNVVSI